MRAPHRPAPARAAAPHALSTSRSVLRTDHLRTDPSIALASELLFAPSSSKSSLHICSKGWSRSSRRDAMRGLFCLLLAVGLNALRLPASMSRRDIVAAAPLLAAAPAFASTVGAAPTPEDEAKFDAILQEKLKEKEKQFAKMGFTLDEEDRKEVRKTVACHACLIFHLMRNICCASVTRRRSTCCGQASAASRPNSSAQAPANRPRPSSRGAAFPSYQASYQGARMHGLRKAAEPGNALLYWIALNSSAPRVIESGPSRRST